MTFRHTRLTRGPHTPSITFSIHPSTGTESGDNCILKSHTLRPASTDKEFFTPCQFIISNHDVSIKTHAVQRCSLWYALHGERILQPVYKRIRRTCTIRWITIHILNRTVNCVSVYIVRCIFSTITSPTKGWLKFPQFYTTYALRTYTTGKVNNPTSDVFDELVKNSYHCRNSTSEW